MRKISLRRRSLFVCSAVAIAAVAALRMSSTFAVRTNPSTAIERSTELRTQIIREHPHDTTAFTEGLEVRGNKVFESSGGYGSSQLRVTDLKTGKIISSVNLDAKEFAEGLAILPNGNFVQLTWKEKVAIVRNAKTLKEVKRFRYEEEGWGLCYSAKLKLLVHSDGSNVLRLRDPGNFKTVRELKVTFPDDTAPRDINELDCSKNTVYANLWQTKRIIQIDLSSGSVVATIDASNLGPASVTSPDDVLNGIASLPNGNLLLTGKRWPKSYEVKLVAGP
jgi:glutaminyl-peptide cyclotransferase